MRKIKIVLFIDWYIPAYKAGGPIKSISNLVNLLKHKADFYIITGDRDIGDNKPFENIKLNKWHKIEGINILYLSKINQNRKEYLYQINLIKPDVIYINGIFSLHFSIKPLLVANKLKIKTIISPRGMLGEGALAIKSYKKYLFLSFAKLFGWYNKIIWHATSMQEKDEIKRVIGQDANISIANNLPIKPKEKRLKSLIKEQGILKLVFISRICKKKNLEFILNIINEYNLEGLELDIYGPIEDKAYYKTSSLLIERINNKDKSRITYKGILAWNQISETIVNYHFLVLPTLNENFSHAIFEAFAEGVPVLISDQTPWQNLKQKNIGYDLPLEKESWYYILLQIIAMGNDEYQLKSKSTLEFASKWYKEQNFDLAYEYLFSKIE